MSGARTCQNCIHYGAVRPRWCAVIRGLMQAHGFCISGFRLDRSRVARANWSAAYRLARIIHREGLDGLLTSAHPVITAASRALEAREHMGEEYDDYDEES